MFYSVSVERLGPWFNINMSSYQYRRSHCGDKTILRPSYLHNGISYTGKMSSLYWIGAQVLLIYGMAVLCIDSFLYTCPDNSLSHEATSVGLQNLANWDISMPKSVLVNKDFPKRLLKECWHVARKSQSEVMFEISCLQQGFWHEHFWWSWHKNVAS